MEDWIEIANPGAWPVDLGGYGLSDNIGQPFKWILPARVLEPGEFLIVFASEKDRGGEVLHCNFMLKSGGESLRLVNTEGAIVDELILQAVTPDVSQGCVGGEHRFLDAPTPGAANDGVAWLGITPAPDFEPGRGIFPDPVTVEIEAQPEDALAWSLDGSLPVERGRDDENGVEPPLSATTTVRARAFRSQNLPSRVVTHSFVIDEPVNLPVVCLTMDPPISGTRRPAST